MLDNALKLSVEVMIKSLERSFDFMNGWFLRRKISVLILKYVFTRVQVKH